MQIERSIQVINTLIQINNYRIMGYKTASDRTSEGALKTLFNQFIYTSKRCNKILAGYLVKLGGVPVNQGRAKAGFLWKIKDLDAELDSINAQILLDFCEYRESKAIDRYEEILEKDAENFTAGQILIIEAQLTLLKLDLYKMKGVRSAVTQHN